MRYARVFPARNYTVCRRPFTLSINKHQRSVTDRLTVAKKLTSNGRENSSSYPAPRRAAPCIVSRAQRYQKERQENGRRNRTYVHLHAGQYEDVYVHFTILRRKMYWMFGVEYTQFNSGVSTCMEYCAYMPFAHLLGSWRVNLSKFLFQPLQLNERPVYVVRRHQ